MLGLISPLSGEIKLDGLKKDDFKNKYFAAFSARATYSSLTVEEKGMNFSKDENATKVYNNLEAMKKIVEITDRNLSPYDVIEIAKIVNKNVTSLPDGFRRVEAIIRGSSMNIESPYYIREAMYSLFNNYYRIWDLLPIYEREAMFHREFIRIHPFEDGNGRTARIITNYNLMINNKAPIIIEKEDRKKYFEMIEFNKIKELANFFEKKSKEEFNTMLDLYQKDCGGNFEENLTDENVKIYNIKRTF